MEPVERVPVEALPRSLPVMERQAEQRQHGIVDLVLIDLHVPNAIPPWSPMSTLFAAVPGGGLPSVKIFGGQMGQRARVDLVVLKRLLVALQPQLAQPTRDVHKRPSRGW
jgi:hypothetical protein